ncbi:hypothetical protein FPOA_08427 [Fusarium poae]|uniref:Uncharacterized protein n=1 Tax=Fusarium poae TaxID=36050 RepID=A0A1B8ANF5_FUSPO|nr:hypothetical protein FPOA_08427 [Fusarium poae]
MKELPDWLAGFKTATHSIAQYHTTTPEKPNSLASLGCTYTNRGTNSYDYPETGEGCFSVNNAVGGQSRIVLSNFVYK